MLRARNDDTATAPQNSSGLYYLHNDHLGIPRAVSDEGQQVVWRWTSDPFGNGLPEEDPDGNGQRFTLNLRFPGQYYDEESGLHYNYFRYYDPSTGRYITSDPIGLDGGLNTYSYVGGNPLRWIDVRGLATATVGGFPGTGSRGIAIPPWARNPIGFCIWAATFSGSVSDSDAACMENHNQCDDTDDDIDCDEWVKLLNMQFAQISAFKRAGGDTRLEELRHNRSVDILCQDPDCGHLCSKVNRF